MRIYRVVVSKSVRTGINIFEFTAQHHSVALSGNMIENYGEAELFEGSVSGLKKNFVVVTF